MTDVVVLNYSYEPHQLVSLKKAANMLARGVVVLEEWVEGQFFGPYPRPLKLRLKRYVHMHFRAAKPRYNKKNLFAREGGMCGYKNANGDRCRNKATTVDHVKPQMLGGETTWLNTVGACQPHNNKKGHKTLAEVKSFMTLIRDPFEPTWTDLARR